jgi:hypothetical protein
VKTAGVILMGTPSERTLSLVFNINLKDENFKNN